MLELLEVLVIVSHPVQKLKISQWWIDWLKKKKIFFKNIVVKFGRFIIWTIQTLTFNFFPIKINCLSLAVSRCGLEQLVLTF